MMRWPAATLQALGPLTVLALAIAACGSATGDGGGAGGPATGADEPGGEIRMARATWDTGFMQAAIYQQLLDELGYDVTDPAEETREPVTFYPALARGELDLWVNGWFPLHEPFLRGELVTGQQISEPIEPVGTQVPAGAIQGYLVDRETAEELDLTSMEDFTRPEVIEAFDDGDGVVELLGCNDGWGCNLAIEDHIESLAWGESVEQVVGDYIELIAEAEQRIAAGEPTLFYTWTPNWTVDVLVPGEDVVWLESPALPDEDDPTSVEGLTGCAGSDPCDLGWVVNDIRAVANADILEDNPPVRRLLEAVEIPLADIAAQNARMNAAEEYTEDDIRADARDWIDANRDLVDEWLATARG
ncbi:MAG: glycine betaine/L-proline ABC transporter substrate-binding protein ProX [Nitriliruptoraceae bacterium]